jgi:hypothetical protein
VRAPAPSLSTRPLSLSAPRRKAPKIDPRGPASRRERARHYAARVFQTYARAKLAKRHLVRAVPPASSARIRPLVS